MSDFQEPVTLGRTGLRVGRLGVASSYGAPASAYELAFHEHGVNLFYWGSLRRAGMRDSVRRLVPRHRDELVIMLQSYDRTGPLMSRFVERGLRRLQIEAADILLLGWHNRETSQRVLDAAMELQSKGKVRYLALSGHHRPLFAELARQPDNPFDVFMVRYNAAHRGAEQEVFPALPETDRPGIITYTNTRWGHLLQPSWMPEGESPMRASDCYRFALSHLDVNVCMTGPASMGQMQEGLCALERGPVTDEERSRFERIGDHVRSRRGVGQALRRSAWRKVHSFVTSLTGSSKTNSERV